MFVGPHTWQQKVFSENLMGQSKGTDGEADMDKLELPSTARNSAFENPASYRFDYHRASPLSTMIKNY